MINSYVKLSGATDHMYSSGYIHYCLLQNGRHTTPGYIYLRGGRCFFGNKYLLNRWIIIRYIQRDNWVTLTNIILNVRERAYRLMINRREDECNGISIYICIRILEILMFLVHVRYGCSFIWGCNVGN